MAKQYKISPKKNYTYNELYIRIIKVYQDKFPFTKSRTLIKSLVSNNFLLRYRTRLGVIRYKPQRAFILPLPLAPPEKRFWRFSKVRQYYAATETQKKTPTPFAEFRVYKVIDKIPTQAEEMAEETLLDKALDRLEWVFKSLFYAKRNSSIRTEVQGLESEQISENEARGKDIGRNYRYAAFYGKDGRVKFEYDEDKIAGMDNGRAVEYKQYSDKKRGAGQKELNV